MELSITDKTYVSDLDALVVLRGGGLPRYCDMSNNAHSRSFKECMLPESITMTPGSHLSVEGVPIVKMVSKGVL